MRTILFKKDGRVIGVLTVQPGMTLTDEHIKKLEAKSIYAQMSNAPTAEHDGNINQWVDVVCETGQLAAPLPLHYTAVEDPAVNAANKLSPQGLLDSAKEGVELGTDDEH